MWWSSNVFLFWLEAAQPTSSSTSALVWIYLHCFPRSGIKIRHNFDWHQYNPLHTPTHTSQLRTLACESKVIIWILNPSDWKDSLLYLAWGSQWPRGPQSTNLSLSVGKSQLGGSSPRGRGISLWRCIRDSYLGGDPRCTSGMSRLAWES